MKSTILAALAVALAAPAFAATPASPACALLTDAEAKGYLGGDPMVSDGGPEMAGTSSCSWLVQSTTAVIGVQVMTPTAFGGAPDSYYDLMVSGVTNAGQKAEPVDGIGTRAVLISDAAATNLVLMAQVGDKLLNVTTMNVTREATIEASKQMAERM
jgi:hypothetical protein